MSCGQEWEDTEHHLGHLLETLVWWLRGNRWSIFRTARRRHMISATNWRPFLPQLITKSAVGITLMDLLQLRKHWWVVWWPVAAVAAVTVRWWNQKPNCTPAEIFHYQGVIAWHLPAETAENSVCTNYSPTPAIDLLIFSSWQMMF